MSICDSLGVGFAEPPRDWFIVAVRERRHGLIAGIEVIFTEIVLAEGPQ
jgi:hypothetical protein